MPDMLARFVVQVTRLQEIGLSDAAIKRLIERQGTSVHADGIHRLMRLGFSHDDARILTRNCGGLRVSVTDFHPKKTAILNALSRGDQYPSEIAAQYDVSRAYVLRLQSLVR